MSSTEKSLHRACRYLEDKKRQAHTPRCASHLEDRKLQAPKPHCASHLEDRKLQAPSSCQSSRGQETTRPLIVKSHRYIARIDSNARHSSQKTEADRSITKTTHTKERSCTVTISLLGKELHSPVHC